MTVPENPRRGSADSSLIRVSLWVAIGALVVAAIVCVVWVLVGTDNDIVGRAFLTILLLAAFAGAALLDARLAPRRPAWFALASMITWVLTLLAGAILIWLPTPYRFYYYGTGFGRFVAFLLIVLILQLALLHARLMVKAHLRFVTPFTRVATFVTIGLVVVLAFMLVIPLTFFDYLDLPSLYWRIVVAIAILAAVGTALVPLVNALFGPKRPARAALVPPPVHAWPTYADGVTPLPVLYDGSPDWNAYYTGYPSTVPQAIAPVAPLAPVAPAGAPAPPYQGWSPADAGQQYPGQATPGYPPQADPGYPPQADPGYPSQADPGYPSQADPGYPPQQGPGGPGYEGYPPPPPLPPRP
ncbi:hypothetical protein ACH3VR_01205 [Microbacterium sp. B2969]|uniref:Uncharacterized protein n=1 Tax=Microbacterium alkaliflavum TaxID=3248839 RepID=A0ABW7Q2L6_9MICO